MKARSSSTKPAYTLNQDGHFVIKEYNRSKLFCNFFPGIAGVWGIPMWVFYVNRGQCIASFGVESKDKAIMEFQPANKAYRLTSTQGFRTFIKAASGGKTVYWEPFQSHLRGTDFKKKQTMSISAHDLTLTEINDDLGLTAEVNYFTLPEEPYSALVRRVTLRNTGRKTYGIELVDGMPSIVPFGLNDWFMKHLARTVEAWVQVKNLNKRAPYFQLSVEVDDKPEVTYIKEGNFFFSFDPDVKAPQLFAPIVESAVVFGAAQGFLAPARFCEDDFRISPRQQTSNRTPSAMSYTSYTLKPNSKKRLVSLFGYAHDQAQVGKIVTQVTKKNFIETKAQQNQALIDGIKDYALTKSASHEFDLYAGYTFLDNVMRGGLPVSIKTGDGNVALNVFSRKHGDLERDYNFFTVAPTFYSQGNGNYRDVNQNRRNDVWFNPVVKDSHVITFLNLIQADGYNPLVVKGTAFCVTDLKKFERALAGCVDYIDRKKLATFVQEDFTPGDLLKYVRRASIKLRVNPRVFLERTLEVCCKRELAEHSEGFWSDHWTYNLDMIESYLSVYPEKLKGLLMDEKAFQFYHNAHYVLPRDRRYILTERGVRQYGSVAEGSAAEGNVLRTKGGHGDVYMTTLACKILCLVANKVASLDPSGIGIEMEANKPNWYDALNGLPGLIGSSVSETFELKRLCLFLLDAIAKLGLKDNENVAVFEELANFIAGLTHILQFESAAKAYWEKSNDLKEHYRTYIRQGIHGNEIDLSVAEMRRFLELVVARTDMGIAAAANSKGFLATYFYHEVVEYESLDKHDGEDGDIYVRPIAFKKHVLPLFLEGYVHALRVERDLKEARKLYGQVRKSALYDKVLKMYKVNASLSGETEEIGRTRIFPPGWLENESIWLHMEYKFLLELLRCGLHEEFYANLYTVLVPFLNPDQYGRSVLENSSFIVSSAHEDQALHGRGFVARLSGSTAEVMHIWLLMNIGKEPFGIDANGELTLTFKPALAAELFTKEESVITFCDRKGKSTNLRLPEDCYAFRLFGRTIVIYHNPRRFNTFGADLPPVKEIRLAYTGSKRSAVISASCLTGAHARDVRDGKVERIDVFFE